MGSFSLLYAISYVIFSFSYFSTLTLNSNDKQGVKFILIFVIMWIGSLIITLNSQFLGANVSIFQSMCLLGYCVFPINIAAILLKFFHFIPLIFKIAISLAAFVWASLGIYFIYYIASVGFMSQMVSEKKKLLANYPIFLFYLFLAWFVLAQ